MEGSAAFLPLTELELQEWMAFDSFDPIGEQRADFRAASIRHELMKANQPGKPIEFDRALLVWDAEEAERKAQERLRASMKGKHGG